MILVTGCNERYHGRMARYLDTLREHADFPWHLITVGFHLDEPYAIGIPHIYNEGAPAETESIQHGSFLNVLETDPDEVIVYTDGDFVMQRRMDDTERDFLDLDHDQVVTGYNFGPHCTLAHDAAILSPYKPLSMLSSQWGEIIHTAQDFNAGFLAMTRKTWERMYSGYMLDWQEVTNTFAHQARQQWLIGYEIAAMGFEVKLCPWSIHAHGHGGLKPGMEWRDGAIYADGKKALFRHYL